MSDSSDHPGKGHYVWSTGQAAHRLGVDASTVYRMGERGQISYMTTPGGHRRYDPAEVEAIAYRLARGEHLGS